MEWLGNGPRKWHETVTRFQVPQIPRQRHGGSSSFLTPRGVPSAMMMACPGARAFDVDGKVIDITPTTFIHRIGIPLGPATIDTVTPMTTIPDSRADNPVSSPDPRLVHPASASANITTSIAIKVTTAIIK